MRVDLKFGRSWGDASHSWEELTGDSAPIKPAPTATVVPIKPASAVPPKPAIVVPPGPAIVIPLPHARTGSNRSRRYFAAGATAADRRDDIRPRSISPTWSTARSARYRATA